MFKKVLVVFAAAVLTMGYAQAQFTFGARAGFNLTSFGGSDKDFLGSSPKMKPGFQIGVVGEYAFGDAFAIQPGILFATQGAKYKESVNYMGVDVDYETTMNLNYIQIPINLQYKVDLGSTKLLLQAGPYLGYGLGGKEKYKVSGGGESESGDYKIKFGSGDDEDVEYVDNAFDFGLGVGAGLQFGNLQAGVGYNFGFTSLFDEGTLKNNGLAITLTYLFGK